MSSVSAIRVAVVTLLLGLGVACAGGPEAGPSPSPTTTASTPAPGSLDEVAVDFGEARVAAEVADSAEERRQGLMGRTSLEADAGMLFLFEERTSGGFWMKDTLIPLSIAFLRSAEDSTFRVIAILDMEPCEADPCPTYDPETSYDAALEVNQGWFAEAGIEVGDEATVTDTGST